MDTVIPMFFHDFVHSITCKCFKDVLIFCLNQYNNIETTDYQFHHGVTEKSDGKIRRIGWNCIVFLEVKNLRVGIVQLMFFYLSDSLCLTFSCSFKTS